MHDSFDFIAEEGDAVSALVFIGRDDLQRIAAHAEGAGFQFHIVALILTLDQLSQQGIAAIDLTHFESDRPFAEFFG